MGALVSCCCGGDEPNTKQGGYTTFQGTTQAATGGPRDTEKDREARALAAERAAQRQTQFEQSAVGKAAYKSVKEVTDSRKAGGGGNNGQPTAADWRD